MEKVLNVFIILLWNLIWTKDERHNFQKSIIKPLVFTLEKAFADAEAAIASCFERKKADFKI